MTRTRNPSKQTLSLLATLAAEPRAWHYGYDLSQRTGLKSGSLYPMLMRLHDRGLLESTWETAAKTGRPPRHMYRLTDAGISFALKALDRVAEPDQLVGAT